MKKISKHQQTINNCIELGRRYLDLSKHHYGWRCTYVNEEGATLDDCYGGIVRLYFAENSDHTAFNYKDLAIAYHSTPTIQFDYDQLDELESKYNDLVELFNKVEAKLSNKSKEESEKERLEKIEGLKKQLESLESLS